ncbi:PLDc N-terminal domain-containing protein [Rathayibacter toxicus]|uniref:PLDc N-terminal domain-containing protein n=1 Tax=Rathayibacter toxicus TaxID=145458 RepID=UPI000CE8C99B|nr:hypothetical protein C5D35_03330 [Rathayibacter toxicus]QOD09945.1 PLDc N-terminal domain-containing protein [Rathayibacter toxicus]QWL28621.1 hypothetical protein E2R33_08440 [Rathayibacter toxicus]
MFTETSYLHPIFFGLSVLILVLSIWALVVTARKESIPLYYKVVWGIVLLLFPGIGLIIWFGAQWWARSRRTALASRAK